MAQKSIMKFLIKVILTETMIAILINNLNLSKMSKNG